MTDYPQWICTQCAESNGGRMPDGHLATWHNGICGWCNEEKSVTQPRDFGYPTCPLRGKVEHIEEEFGCISQAYFITPQDGDES